VKLTVGQTLHSATDATTVIVVRAPADEVTITWADAGDAGLQLGKRYASEELALEVLCTKAGGAALEVNGAPLPIKDAKPLPASD
jgi:hypothetical protein